MKEEEIKRKIEQAEKHQQERLKINRQNLEVRLKAKQRMENRTTADVEAEIDDKLDEIFDNAVDGEIDAEAFEELCDDIPSPPPDSDAEELTLDIKPASDAVEEEKLEEPEEPEPVKIGRAHV